jgi:hypothetical protein
MSGKNSNRYKSRKLIGIVMILLSVAVGILWLTIDVSGLDALAFILATLGSLLFAI